MRNIIEPIERRLPSVSVVASLTGRRMNSCEANDSSIPMAKQTPNPRSRCVRFSVLASFSCWSSPVDSASSSSCRL